MSGFKLTKFFDKFKADFTKISVANGFSVTCINSNFQLNKDDITYTIVIDNEIVSEELSAVKFTTQNAIGGSDFCNILLKCPEGFNIPVDQEIKFEGYFKARLSQNKSPKAILFNEVEKILDFSKLSESAEYDYSALLCDDIIICDVESFPNGNIAKSNDSFKKLIFEIANHIIAAMLYKYNINLTLYTETQILESNTICIYNDIIVKKAASIEALQYFIEAEKSDSMNFKYLDYYHVLEYFFNDEIRNRIDGFVDDVLLSKLQGDINIETKKSIAYDNIISLFSNNKSENHELKQLKAVINKISDNKFIEIINNIHLDINSFKKPILQTQDGRIGIEKITVKNGKISLSSDPLELQNLKLQWINRIYLLRNFLVHTKKGEKNIVFLPTKDNLNNIVNDVKVIREIAFYILFMS